MNRMANFHSWYDYLHSAISVTSEARYILSPFAKQFVESVMETSCRREHVAPEGTILWRAQLGSDSEDVEHGGLIVPRAIPFRPDRMKPAKDRAFEGRVNSKGIPSLYLSHDRETAMSEVRPWIGELISIAEFVVVEDVRLVDCSRLDADVILDSVEAAPKKIEDSVWKCIDQSFSEPVTRSDSAADYAPTQILSEAFKSQGFQGVAYKSSLSDGLNIALFSIDLAECVRVDLVKTTSVKYQFGPS
jgi:hypothetical protein